MLRHSVQVQVQVRRRITDGFGIAWLSANVENTPWGAQILLAQREPPAATLVRLWSKNCE
jgi:hypothetical protein